MRRSLTVLTLPFVALLAFGCSTKKDGTKTTGTTNQASDTADVTTPQVATTPAPASPAAAAAPASPAALTGTPGMPSLCTYTPATATSANGCFSCTPREIPVTGCAKFAADFDPKTSCAGDTHLMTCTLAGSTTPFTFNFDQKTLAETAYDDIPLLVVIGKPMITSTLTKTPQIATVINNLLDVIAANRDTIFKPTDTTPMVTALETSLQQAVPVLGAIDFTTLNPLISQEITSFRALAESKDFTIDQLTGFVTSLLNLIPSGAGSGVNLGSLISSTFNIPSLLASLSGSSDVTSASLFSRVQNLQQMSLKIKSGN